MSDKPTPAALERAANVLYAEVRYRRGLAVSTREKERIEREARELDAVADWLVRGASR